MRGRAQNIAGKIVQWIFDQIRPTNRTLAVGPLLDLETLSEFPELIDEAKIFQVSTQDIPKVIANRRRALLFVKDLYSADRATLESFAQMDKIKSVALCLPSAELCLRRICNGKLKKLLNNGDIDHALQFSIVELADYIWVEEYIDQWKYFFGDRLRVLIQGKTNTCSSQNSVERSRQGTALLRDESIKDILLDIYPDLSGNPCLDEYSKMLSRLLK